MTSLVSAGFGGFISTAIPWVAHSNLNSYGCHSERSVPVSVSPEIAPYDFRSGRSGGESHLQDELSPRNKVEESLLRILFRSHAQIASRHLLGLRNPQNP